MMILLLSLLPLCFSMKYKVEVKTKDETYAGTNDNVAITIHGTLGSTSPYYLDNAWYDDFEPGNVDLHEFFRYEDVGTILCVTLETDGTDDLILDHVYVTRSIWNMPDIWFYMVNKEETPLTNDPMQYKTLKLCEDRCYRYLPVNSDVWTLEDMTYNTKRGIIYPTSTVKVGEITVDARDSSVSQQSSINLATTISDTLTFTHEQGITVSSDVTFTSGIPKVVDGSISVSHTQSEHNSFSKSNTIQESVSFNFPCVAAAGRKVTCKAYQEKYQMEIKFDQVWRHKTQKCTYSVDGVSVVDSDSTISMEVEEE